MCQNATGVCQNATGVCIIIVSKHFGVEAGVFGVEDSTPTTPIDRTLTSFKLLLTLYFKISCITTNLHVDIQEGNNYIELLPEDWLYNRVNLRGFLRP